MAIYPSIPSTQSLSNRVVHKLSFMHLNLHGSRPPPMHTSNLCHIFPNCSSTSFCFFIPLLIVKSFVCFRTSILTKPSLQSSADYENHSLLYPCIPHLILKPSFPSPSTPLTPHHNLRKSITIVYILNVIQF